jgi:hypothetical protein
MSTSLETIYLVVLTMVVIAFIIRIFIYVYEDENEQYEQSSVINNNSNI